MKVKKELMRSTEAQPKINRRPDEHAWHALWHALGDIAGKTGLFSKESFSTLKEGVKT